MNVDDPYGELPADGKDHDEDENEDARKPAARKNFGPTKCCEYCGKKGHATPKSKKCSAIDGNKKYNRDDGTLLSLQATAEPAVDNDDDFVMDAMILDDDHQLDCHQNDLIPFDNDVQDDDSDVDLFHDAGTWEEDTDDEEDPFNL
jgi:hypothetical protein